MSYRSSLSKVLADVVAPAAEVTGEQGRFPRAAVTALGRAGLLGLTARAADGGGGRGCAEAAEVVARTARVCPATAAVLTSHFAAVAALGVYGNPWLRGEIAAGRHLATLALGDIGPEGFLAEEGTGRRHLWPGGGGSTAVRSGGVVALRARRRAVVAAGEADSYLWSSEAWETARPTVPQALPGRPRRTDRGGVTLWVVPAHAPDLFVPARPDGAGPGGSGTSTVCADPVLVPADAMLGPDGGGGGIVLGVVRPWLLELTAAMTAEGPRTREAPCGEPGFADARSGTGPSQGAGGRDVRSGAGPAGAARSEGTGLAPACRPAGTLAPT
ncbi:acyl-CoA dehydrogenase family protein [Streptomyces sp. NBC_00198]|uniref:acyl-CoA dehydrogenase family protein n=1 Tax=Streptomyces sp. NBC_00198 TaxID=2975677 RepID=UPI0022561C00|nr:acyl-CoA dehydrogenase family protein [Streptomyces sp. NBC_00198]MCX5280101.1 acyl-CoA/acyl-ACP dehydrogenase [Streptomyces sp. NBC_00198]